MKLGAEGSECLLRLEIVGEVTDETLSLVHSLPYLAALAVLASLGSASGRGADAGALRLGPYGEGLLLGPRPEGLVVVPVAAGMEWNLTESHRILSSKERCRVAG